MRSSFAQRRNAFARSRDRHGIVGIALKCPHRRIRRERHVVRAGAAAAGNCRREEFLAIGSEVPHAHAAHRLSCEVNPPVVDRKFTAQRVDHLQRHLGAVSQSGQGSRRPLRKIVARPTAVGLRRQHVTRKTFLVFRQRKHPRAENISQPHLFFVVIAEPAAAVQINHQRQFPAGALPRFWLEEAIGHIPIALERARLEFLRDSHGFFLERLDQCLALRGHRRAGCQRRYSVILSCAPRGRRLSR